jgi:hypothetical protein
MSVIAQLPAHTIYYSPNASIEANGDQIRAEMSFRCAYPDRFAFINVVSGLPETIDIGGGVTITRSVPLRHPDFPELLANGYRGEGFGMSPDVFGYTNWRVQVSFGSVPFPIVGDRPFMEVGLDHGGTYTTVPGEGMVFLSDGKRLRHDYGVFVPEQNYTVTTYFNPGLDDALIDSLLGKVNSSPFLGKAVGCARFNSCATRITQTINGQMTYTKMFSMSFRRRPWNEVLRPGMVWDMPVGESNGLPAHESADLNLLL